MPKRDNLSQSLKQINRWASGEGYMVEGTECEKALYLLPPSFPDFYHLFPDFVVIKLAFTALV